MGQPFLLRYHSRSGVTCKQVHITHVYIYVCTTGA